MGINSSTMRDESRDARRAILRTVALVIFFLTAVASVSAQEPPKEDPESRNVIRMLQDVSRALQAGNPASFLSFFDRNRFAQYAALETQIVALSTQSDVASSMDVIGIERANDIYRVRVDWLLQLTVKETPGPLETRREILQISAAKGKKGAWKIIGLEPVDFFRSQGSPRP